MSKTESKPENLYKGGNSRVSENTVQGQKPGDPEHKK